jgi:hypothetical protein
MLPSNYFIFNHFSSVGEWRGGDIYAKVMMMTLCAALAFPIEGRVVAEYNADKKKGRVKHDRKINRTYAHEVVSHELQGCVIPQ